MIQARRALVYYCMKRSVCEPVRLSGRNSNLVKRMLIYFVGTNLCDRVVESPCGSIGASFCGWVFTSYLMKR